MPETSESTGSLQQERPSGSEWPWSLRVLLVDGDTAGHVNPLLATVAALRDPALDGDLGTQILVLGTAEGLEKRLVPEAGLELALVPRVPLPRRPSGDLLRLPHRLGKAISTATEVIEKVKADIVVGFSDYVLTPAYLAAGEAGVPVVIHEQDAHPGLANRLGVSWTQVVTLAFVSTRLKASKSCTKIIGLSLRPVIATLIMQCATDEGIRQARAEGAQTLGLGPGFSTLLVAGESLGTQHPNEVLSRFLRPLLTGLQVLHLTDKDKDTPVRAALEAVMASGVTQDLAERYYVLSYLTMMEQAYACADGVLCRSGAGTVVEITTLGLPTPYVPLPIGNGEQRPNTADALTSGGGRMVLGAGLKSSDILDFVMLISDPERQVAMIQAVASTGVQDAAARLIVFIRQCASIRNTPTDEGNTA